MKRIRWFLSLMAGAVLLLLAFAPPALACGGLFCQNTPVDQSAERIIFTVDPGQISAYVQINYTGSAPDFAWVVPVPAVPEVDVAEMDSFNEIQSATDPVFQLPPVPECMYDDRDFMFGGNVPMVMESESAAEDVTVYASGTAGPYAYDVVGTETDNANALIDWLNENNYRITAEMEPLVHVYVDEQMLFLAMKLQPDQGVQDIQPVKMTYASERPMIPIRLTAVAANPNMGIYTWIYGRARSEPLNFANLEVDGDDIELTNFFAGATNYRQLVASDIDRFGGHAFITEYAQPSASLPVTDPLLQELRQRYPYITRLYGQMSPEEMTIDPVFGFNNDMKDISNVFDLTDRTDLYPCQDGAVNIELPVNFNTNSSRNTSNLAIPYFLFGILCAGCLLALGALFGGGIAFVTGRGKKK